MKTGITVIVLVLFLYGIAAVADSVIPPKRIVSLAPSMTEILYALGLGDNIVGVTTFCDYPEEAKKKPKIGGMSNPSLEAVVSLKPDIVVLTTDGNPEEFEERLVSLKIKTFVFQARRLSELPQGIRELGRALGIKERADKLAQEIEDGIGKERKSSLSSRPSSIKRRVLFIVWPEPLIVAGPGTVIDDAITLLGHENIAATAMTNYPKYSLEEVIRQAPDVLFIGKSMGNDMRPVSQGLLKRLSTVPAVKNGKVFFVSDKLFRLGPRVVRGIEELAECLK
jgi:iron complex transport system substrate-binding protein